MQSSLEGSCQISLLSGQGLTTQRLSLAVRHEAEWLCSFARGPGTHLSDPPAWIPTPASDELLPWGDWLHLSEPVILI